MDKIKGYRELTADEVDAINCFKMIEATINSQIDLMRQTTADARHLAIAASNFETAFMYVAKAIAKPERLTNPEIDKQIADAMAKREEETVQ
jgi:hypothetical protein